MSTPLRVCLGSILELSCITNGNNRLGWIYNADNILYSASDLSQAPRSVGLFTTELICVRNGVFTSVATITVTSDINGTTLECADDLFSLSSTSFKNFTFFVIGINHKNLITTVSLICYLVNQQFDNCFILLITDDNSTNNYDIYVTAISEDRLQLVWPETTCISLYSVEVNGSIVSNQVGNTYVTKPMPRGIHNVLVTGKNYLNFVKFEVSTNFTLTGKLFFFPLVKYSIIYDYNCNEYYTCI